MKLKIIFDVVNFDQKLSNIAANSWALKLKMIIICLSFLAL